MPQSIPKGLTAEHVRLALRDLDDGIERSFGAPTGYEVVHEGRRYPPKAVVGLAFRHLQGDVLPPEAFSGGEAPGQANFVLRQLGFTVEKKGEEKAESEKPADWSEEEVSLIVADYFDMLRLDLADRPFSKAGHNEALRQSLNGRSKSSVEFKHQNISDVLLEMGLPYIDGYKPAKNYQKRLLPQAVETYLDSHLDVAKELETSPVLNPSAPPALAEGSMDGYFDDPPDRMAIPRADSKPWLSRRGRKVDFDNQDAQNRQLGLMGEKFTLEIEQRRLKTAGRDDLAAKVEWISQTCGDGVGFDVLSFDEMDDSEQCLEVKTTCLGKYFPFVVTENERRCSEDIGYRFHLYRVFNFSRRPRVYVLSGALSKTCQLEPVQYRASVISQSLHPSPITAPL